MIHLPLPVRMRIGDAMTQTRIALTGEQLAKAIDCSQSNVSQAEKNGHGPFNKTIGVIYELKNAVGMTCTQAQADKAIHAIVSLICEISGYQAFRALDHSHDFRGMLEAAELILNDSSVVIRGIRESIREEGEKGRDIAPTERDEIINACNQTIEHLGALKELAIRICKE